MDDIARHADVGIGTVYRRFPDKQQLIEVLFESRLREIAAAAHDALKHEDPWQGLVQFLEYGVALMAADRGVKELIIGTGRGPRRIERARRTTMPLIGELIERARESGQLRPDIAATDGLLVMLMVGAIADYTREVAPETWKRYLTITLDGLRTRRDAPTPLPAPPLDIAQLNAAMVR